MFCFCNFGSHDLIWWQFCPTGLLWHAHYHNLIGLVFLSNRYVLLITRIVSSQFFCFGKWVQSVASCYRQLRDLWPGTLPAIKRSMTWPTNTQFTDRNLGFDIIPSRCVYPISIYDRRKTWNLCSRAHNPMQCSQFVPRYRYYMKAWELRFKYLKCVIYSVLVIKYGCLFYSELNSRCAIWNCKSKSGYHRVTLYRLCGYPELAVNYETLIMAVNLTDGSISCCRDKNPTKIKIRWWLYVMMSNGWVMIDCVYIRYSLNPSVFWFLFCQIFVRAFL